MAASPAGGAVAPCRHPRRSPLCRVLLLLRAQIHFRPLRLEEYDDCIEFATEDEVTSLMAYPEIMSEEPGELHAS